MEPGAGTETTSGGAATEACFFFYYFSNAIGGPPAGESPAPLLNDWVTERLGAAHFPIASGAEGRRAHPLPNGKAGLLKRAPTVRRGKAGAALERGAGEDGAALAAAGALPGRAARRRRHHRGGAAVPQRRLMGLAVAAGVATAGAGTAAEGLRRVPVPRLLGGAGGLAAPLRGGGAAARPPRLLQSVPARRPGGPGKGCAWPRPPGQGWAGDRA